MLKSYKFLIPSTILICASIISFLILANSNVSADESIVSNVSVSVPVSCNITSALDTPHTATINPGQYKEDIGTTTFKVFCNDNTGYALYAIGFSNEEYGNTNLLPTNTTNPSIATGLATSGNASAWAMKLTPVTTESSGTTQPYVPTIENGYENYSLVPEEYTKVATFTSTTDFTIGSSLTSTYRAFIQGMQPADTYNGKVKYTLVHPNDANPPVDPSKVAYLDTGLNVNNKLHNFVIDLARASSLPTDFVATEENTISLPDSPVPVYIFNDDTGDYCGRGYTCLYTNAEKIYLNNDSSYLFYNWEGFQLSENLLGGFDVSNVTNMSHMFECMSVYSSDIINWNTSNVTDMSYMFSANDSCPESHDILGGNSNTFAGWDVSNVTNMSHMFDSFASYSVVNDEIMAGMAGWDVSNVTDMSGMFEGTSSFTNIDALSNWDTSSVTNMSNMFFSATSLTDISGAANWNTSNVTNVSYMFYYVNNIDATVLNNWDVFKVTNKQYAFTCPADKRPSWY